MRLFEFFPLSKKGRLFVAAVITTALGFGIVSSAGAVSSITLYKNNLKSSSGRLEVNQYGGGTCKRGGAAKAFRARVGKSTRECFFRVQPAGRDLEVSATARIFRSTPKKVRPRVYAAVSLRQARDGSRYQLVVYPSGKRFQLRKVFEDGRILTLDGGKLGKKVKGFNEANRLTLRAYNDIPGQPSGSARLVAIVNGNRVSVTDDPRGNLLQGQDTTFSIGSTKGANGAIGSFNGIVVRMPSPF